jgi:hypothetical protein
MVLHLAVCVSPLLVLLPRKFSGFTVGKMHMLKVSAVVHDSQVTQLILLL